MKRTHKKALGYLGLALVAATTGIAVIIPSPETSATSSVTDTIQVRVVGSTPDVNISGIENRKIYTDAKRPFVVDYANIETLSVGLEYTDRNDDTYSITLGESVPDYDPNTQNFTILPDTIASETGTDDYGYGHYVVSANGAGISGPDDDGVEFWYIPVYPTIRFDEDTGEYYLDLEYEIDDGTGNYNGHVDAIEINIYDKDGNLVESISPISVTAPTTTVKLPFEDALNAKSGEYTVVVSAYDEDEDGDKTLLYKPYPLTVDYEVVPVPDTGRFFQNLNISKEDYLITGLILFFVIGIVGFGVVWKGGKKTVATRSATNATKANAAKRSSSHAKANIARKPVSTKKTSTARKAASTRKTSNAKKRR